MVGIVDRGLQMASVYVDGTLAGPGPLPAWIPWITEQLDHPGQDPTGTDGTATYTLDDVGIWDRALSSL